MAKKEASRKRGRNKPNEEDEQQAYYDRLLHQCRKDLHKHAKLAKSFECQKLIRKIKQESKNDNHQSSSSTSTQHEAKLQSLKEFELEPVVDECFRRLGVLQIDPRRSRKLEAKSGDETKEEGGDEGISVETRKEEEVSSSSREGAGTTTKATSWMLERVMKHKRLVSALEKWNEQIADYRRWCLNHQQRDGSRRATKKNKASKRELENQNKFNADRNELSSGASLFLTLGDDDDDNANDSRNDEGVYGDAADDYYGPADGKAKKNRKGQRARRAKAEAIAARKEGRRRLPTESLNWRKKANQQEKEHSQQQLQQSSGHRHRREDQWKHYGKGTTNRQQQQQRGQHQPPKQHEQLPNESLHPSWQARKAQKEGIVTFQGKKITFD